MLFLLLTILPVVAAYSLTGLFESGDASNDTDETDEPGLRLEGDEGDNYLSGSTGDDVLNGGQGVDTLVGADGDDELYGGTSYDILLGGDGDDTLSGQYGSDWLGGGEGNDLLQGGNGSDVLNGTPHGPLDPRVLGYNTFLSILGQSLTTTAEDVDDADRLDGGDANDLLILGANDTGVGGDGQDMFAVRDDVSAPATVEDYSSDDQLVVVYETFSSYFETSSLEITQDDAGNAVIGDSENIFMILTGQAGNIGIQDISFARLSYNSSNGGTDINHVEFIGGDDPDLVEGFDVDERVFAGGGNDEVYGNGGDDDLHGEDGDDYLNGGLDDDSLWGEAGADTLLGNFGADRLFGGEGDDSIDGGFGTDTAFGGGGDDTILAEYSEGGDGNDYVLTRQPSNAQPSLRAADVEAYALGQAGNDTLIGGIALLDGGEGDDVLTSNSVIEYRGDGDINAELYHAGTLVGGDGDDTLSADLSFADDRFIAVVDSPIEMTGGEGEDEFRAITVGEQASYLIPSDPNPVVATVTDYMPGEDVIIVEVPEAPTTVTVTPQGEDALVEVDGEEIFLIQNAGATLTVADVQIVVSS